MNNYLMLDIDGVIALESQFNSNPKKWNKEFNIYSFDSKCVKILNEIIEKTNPTIILSSDWKNHYTLEQMNQIFELNKVNSKVTDYTSTLWGIQFKDCSTELEICRATEILNYVKEHNIENYVAIDDLNLEFWIPNNFVHIKRFREGIKQCGIKDKIIAKLINNK